MAIQESSQSRPKSAAYLPGNSADRHLPRLSSRHCHTRYLCGKVCDEVGNCSCQLETPDSRVLCELAPIRCLGFSESRRKGRLRRVQDTTTTILVQPGFPLVPGNS